MLIRLSRLFQHESRICSEAFAIETHIRQSNFSFDSSRIKTQLIMRLAGVSIVIQFITLHLVSGLWVGLRPTKATLDSAKFVFFNG